MTAVLSPQFDETFGSANARDIFFSNREQDAIERLEEREIAPVGVPGDSCNINLFFGFFFDGTRNNYVKAEHSKTHSNVARLYDCFPGLCCTNQGLVSMEPVGLVIWADETGSTEVPYHQLEDVQRSAQSARLTAHLA
jgi:hypothetical protein